MNKQEALVYRALQCVTGAAFDYDARDNSIFKRGKNCLRPDFYNHHLKLVVEYNGPLHYLPAMTSITQNDIYKRQKCQENDILMIVVPFVISESRYAAFIYFSLIISKRYKNIHLPPPLKKHYFHDINRVGLLLTCSIQSYLKLRKDKMVMTLPPTHHEKFNAYTITVQCRTHLARPQMVTLRVAVWQLVPELGDVPDGYIHIPGYLMASSLAFVKYWSTLLVDSFDYCSVNWKYNSHKFSKRFTKQCKGKKAN